MDVLKVMDEAVEILNGDCHAETANKIHEARAAVAELIEATREGLTIRQGIPSSDQIRDSNKRIRAALAKASP